MDWEGLAAKAFITVFACTVPVAGPITAVIYAGAHLADDVVAAGGKANGTGKSVAAAVAGALVVGAAKYAVDSVVDTAVCDFLTDC